MTEIKAYQILIVDDDDLLRGVLVDVFKTAKFEVMEAMDGLEGLNIATAHKPDVVITGIMMPSMTGFEFFEALKKNMETVSIPVLIFSHLGREEDRQQALKLGAKAFLVKGMISPKQTVDLVLNLLNSKVYRVAINPDNFDASRFMEDMGCKTGGVLELTPDPDSDLSNFKARFICQ
ncbi:MAG: response regulator [Patescibacteria group bacterium]